jgi:F0F1-type ATP synthase membrane subunit b/b'
MGFFDPQNADFLLFVAVGVLLINIILLLLVTVLVFSFAKRLAAYQQKARKTKKDAEDLAAQKLEQATMQATAMVQEASTKAGEMLSKSTVVSEQFNQAIENELREISQQHAANLEQAAFKYIAAYQEMSQNAQEEYQLTLHEASKALSVEAKQTLDLFNSFLKDQTINYEKSIEHRIEELRQAAKQEIALYKETELKKVDAGIEKVLLAVSRDVLGKSITLQDHHNLILHALKNAKLEGFFEK